MDMTAMTYKHHSFDVVFEKATLDSLVVDCQSPWNLQDPSYVDLLKALKEVKKVLKPGGLFISITFTQPHFRVPLLASQGLGWSVQVNIILHFTYLSLASDLYLTHGFHQLAPFLCIAGVEAHSISVC